MGSIFSRIQEQVDVFRHEHERHEIVIMPRGCPFNRYAQETPPYVVREQRQTVVTRKSKLVAMAGIMVVSDPFPMR
jgi:hypothetical protein